MKRFLLLFALLALPAAAAPMLVAEGEPETVFRWAAQRCDALHIPDSPARAVRLPDGSLMLVAAHYTNVPLRGRDFGNLAPDCAAAGRGAENPDPASFDDRFWVQAVLPLPDGRVLGLASHEFMGKRHAGACAVTEGPGWTRCWYSSITVVVARAPAWRFGPLPLPGRVIAASPEAYSGTTPRRTGFFTTSNIVLPDGHAHVLSYTEGVPGQPRGNCLLRAPLSDAVAGWRALAADGTFRLHLGMGRDAEPCATVTIPGYEGPVRSVVRLGADGPFVGVLAGRARDAATGQMAEGVFQVASDDLRRWSAPRLLLAATPFRSQPDPGLYYAYPSLIDHESSSPVFDTAEGGALRLYLTRFNLAEDRRAGMNRDLVRWRVRVTGPG